MNLSISELLLFNCVLQYSIFTEVLIGELPLTEALDLDVLLTDLLHSIFKLSLQPLDLTLKSVHVCGLGRGLSSTASLKVISLVSSWAIDWHLE